MQDIISTRLVVVLLILLICARVIVHASVGVLLLKHRTPRVIRTQWFQAMYHGSAVAFKESFRMTQDDFDELMSLCTNHHSTSKLFFGQNSQGTTPEVYLAAAL